ncbi:MAG: OmpA family protein [Candidatus Pseudomonas phytovorans]|uniref:OmpA family protein n=1 Tax=Candidatus Pseudomonas phytovorans TaxID=3121377 RepID=A0AAJ5WET3_9PSED|nr:OmpA family protein [Pseudomonas sp.]WEK29093.1 MAG: OmpA family protein [Pseudomonas sp.]
MNSCLRYLLPVLCMLATAACTVDPLGSDHRLLVNPDQADAFNERALRLQSDERETAGGLVVYFATDSAAVAEKDIPRLGQVAGFLLDHPQAEVFIEGHTDDEGSPEQNVVLAQARADMIAYYLVKYGALYDQLNTRAYGERYPAHEGSDAEAMQYNRRVVVEWNSRSDEFGYDPFQ